MRKLQKFILTQFWQKFRESDGFTLKNYCWFDEIFLRESKFFIVQCVENCFRQWQKIRQIRCERIRWWCWTNMIHRIFLQLYISRFVWIWERRWKKFLVYKVQKTKQSKIETFFIWFWFHYFSKWISLAADVADMQALHDQYGLGFVHASFTCYK